MFQINGSLLRKFCLNLLGFRVVSNVLVETKRSFGFPFIELFFLGIFRNGSKFDYSVPERI